MAIDLWNDDEEEYTGEYVQDNEFPVIPHDTRVMALIDKCEWEVKKNYKNREAMEDCISVRFEIESGEFKGQKIFKKFFIKSDNDDQARKDYTMFMNVDALAGGKIKALKKEPGSDDLSRCLINKSMVIIIGKMDGKNGEKGMNYLMGVSSGKSAKSAKQEIPLKPQPTKREPTFEDLDDDVPF